MKNYITLLILLFVCSALSAQQSETVYVKGRDKEALYLKFSGNAPLRNCRMTEMNTPVYANKENAVNVYINWLNPLKYKVGWKDTVIADERDALVREFLAGLVDQFKFKSEALSEKNESDTSSRNYSVDVPIMYPFNDPSLMVMTLYVYNNKEKLAGVTQDYNKIIEELINLEKLQDESFSGRCSTAFMKLSKAETAVQMSQELLIQKGTKEDLLAKIDSISESVRTIKNHLLLLKSNESELLSFIKGQISNYLQTVITKNVKWKPSVEKLDKIICICEKSLLHPSPSLSDSYFLQTVEFENGKQLEAEIKIIRYEYDTVSMTISSEKVAATQRYKFMKYDCVDVFVSAGFFYASSDIPAFGLSGDSVSGFTVGRQNLLKNTAIPATFLNLSFNVSRYFSPLIQLGVDPTKKRPYMLLGTGFSIPAAHFSISGGPFWTWVPTLNKLEVGDRIASTLDLEKDIKYSFDVVPRGWYLGIQYNFK